METPTLGGFTPPTHTYILNWFHDLYGVLYTSFLPTRNITNINHFPWSIIRIIA